eukprot:CAMPEP_0118924224 /NCGR_PEP_ID=MMETSP1169-20130426/2455_1 /TAXON_ID=36882 /ORGANISM="Pyramimonas obovata, Strain CCMP722" /LENGTH=189 /DNA_ID=CAMNT_0006865315 /DNA_START=139 /DNA_END=706 /DNA_ORIENTATION=-
MADQQDQSGNQRIYVTGFPEDATEDEVRELFSGIGVIARVRQKRGYKDQWPFAIKMYKDDSGKLKGDGTVTYEDPSAAQAAPDFFNGYSMRGSTLTVQMATMAHHANIPKAAAEVVVAGLVVVAGSVVVAEVEDLEGAAEVVVEETPRMTGCVQLQDAVTPTSLGAWSATGARLPNLGEEAAVDMVAAE